MAITPPPLLALLASSLAMASAWNCSAWSKAKQTSTGGFCTDHDQGHIVPSSGTSSVTRFGEKTCSGGEAFFYGEDAGKTYIWCAAACASGCGTDMPQCKALYRRKCNGAPPPPPDTIGGLVLVPQGPRGAACLDGSPPGYWMDQASAVSNASKWVIHAQGGGWCWNEAECASRAKGGLGSSKGWGQTTSCYGKCDGILSKNSTENPDFSSWNRASAPTAGHPHASTAATLTCCVVYCWCLWCLCCCCICAHRFVLLPPPPTHRCLGRLL